MRLAMVLAPVVGLAALVAVLLFGGIVGTVSGGVPVESLAVEDARLTPARSSCTSATTAGPRSPSPRSPWTTRSAPSPPRRPHWTDWARSPSPCPIPGSPRSPVHVTVLTSTGTVVEYEIASPSLTPTGTSTTLGTLALIGLAMAAVPVALGLLWLPFLRRASARVTGAVLAFTLGLLAFLLVDSTAEGLELAGELGAGLNGIGLHNLGEGLAVGTAMRVGEVALGTALVIGFAIHNLTERVAIAAPLTRAWAVLGLGIAAGAIAQVILAVGRLVVSKPGPLAAASFTAAVGLMYLTGLLA